MLAPHEALHNWNLNLPVQPCPDQGLINHTYLVGSPPQYVLQWVNPIFDPRIHYDLHAIIQQLRQLGETMPELLLNNQGEPFTPAEKGCWRIWSYIEGRTLHKITTPSIAAAAGRLVGQFHRALAQVEHQFIAPSRDVHNTPQRMQDLQLALDKATGHPLEKPATALGQQILQAWSRWDGELDLPKRICHGDLKISNLRFAHQQDKGVCLLDLDTIGPQNLAAELGDAWRSWCNPSGEDEPEKTRFDIDIFRASAQGWLSNAPHLQEQEITSLVPGIERICLELSARFCADSINNTYFKENRQRYPQIGQHNLIRSTSQFRLACSAKQQRIPCEQIITRSIQEKQ